MTKLKYMAGGAVLTAALLVTGMTGVYGDAVEGENITLENVRNWAAADNIESERLFEDLEDARQDLADAEDDKGSGDSDLERKKSYSYDIDDAQLTLDETLWEIESTTATLDLEAVELYFNLQSTEEAMGLQSLTINQAQLAYDEAVTKFDMGLETQLNVDSAAVDLRAAEAEMTRLSYTYDSYILDLNQLINRDLTDSYVFEIAEVPEIDAPYPLSSEAIDNAIEANMDLSFMYRELTLLEELEEIYDDLNDDDDYDDEIKSTRLSIEEQEMSIDDEIRSIEVEIRTAYNDLLTSADDITISVLNLENQRIDLAKAEEELVLGQVTENYVESLMSNIRDGELSLDQAEVAYYVDVMEYNLLLEGYSMTHFN